MSFTLLLREFGFFTTLGETDGEVMSVLMELCSTPESLQLRSEIANDTGRRESIIDPGVVRVKGRQATNTSARVDRTANPPSTKTVDKHQASTFGKSPSRKPRRHHICHVCLKGGHHSKTCVDVLLDEHTQRANAFSETSS